MNPFRRRPTPPAPPTPPTPPATTEDATRQIADIARQWIDIAGERSRENARLRAELATAHEALRQMQPQMADMQSEIDKWRAVSAHWYTIAIAQRRQAIPAVLGENIIRYIHTN